MVSKKICCRVEQGIELSVMLLIVAAIVFGVSRFGGVREEDRSIIECLVAIALLLWGGRLAFGSFDSDREVPFVAWILLIGLMYATYCTKVARVSYAARGEFTTIIVCSAVFCLVYGNSQSVSKLNSAVRVIVVIGMIIAGYGLYQRISGDYRVWGHKLVTQYVGRASGTFVNPNHFAGFLAMILPLAMGQAVSKRSTHVWRIVMIYAALLIIAGIVASNSRGGWMAATAAVVIFFLLIILRLRQRDLMMPALLALGIPTILIGVWILSNPNWLRVIRLDKATTEFREGTYENVRFRIWRTAWKLYREHPIIGIGPGHFALRAQQYREPSLQSRPVYAHNDYLNILLDWGGIGMALFIAGFGALVARIYSQTRMMLGNEEAEQFVVSGRFALSAGATSAFFGICVQSCVDFNWHIPANALVTSLCAAIAILPDRAAGRSSWRKKGRLLAAGIGLLAISLSVVLGIHSLREYEVQNWFRRAKAAGLSSEERELAILQALLWDPDNYHTMEQLGELKWALAKLGTVDSDELAMQAYRWFAEASRLNPFEAQYFVRQGMAMDWIGRHDEALQLFNHALSLDPNGSHNLACYAWHFLQIDDYVTARRYLERSWELEHPNNPFTEFYLNLVKKRQAEMVVPRSE